MRLTRVLDSESRYWQVWDRVMNVRIQRNSFRQLMGEHGVRVVELIVAVQLDKKIDMMKTWEKLSFLRDEWIKLVTWGLDHRKQLDRDFEQIARAVIRNYNDTMQSFIVTKNVSNDKLKEASDKEARFFSLLSSKRASYETTKEWKRYTQSIVSTVRVAVHFGIKADEFYQAATTTVNQALLLGIWLDEAID